MTCARRHVTRFWARYELARPRREQGNPNGGKEGQEAATRNADTRQSSGNSKKQERKKKEEKWRGAGCGRLRDEDEGIEGVGEGFEGELEEGWKKERVGLGCCSAAETGRGEEAPVMKSAIRIPSSNLRPNLYIKSVYSCITDSRYEVRAESESTPPEGPIT